MGKRGLSVVETWVRRGERDGNVGKRGLNVMKTWVRGG